MKKSARKASIGAISDNNIPSFDELSDWSAFKGVIGRGYQQACPNPSIPLNRFISILEEKLK
jgi:hypothetical protein